VDVRLGYFPQVQLPQEKFHAVAMVEVIEHMPDHETALRRAYQMLRHDGCLYLSASCYRSSAHKADAEDRPASRHAMELYGYTAMVALSTLVKSVEDAGFSVVSLTDLTSNYRRTMIDWRAGIAANRDRMEEVAPGFATEVSKYFETASASWGYTARNYALSAIRSRLGKSRYVQDRVVGFGAARHAVRA
jgi:cyclopropane-fatty-acyl-phospholipid synthase